MGYSKAPEQSQTSARPICHSHAMTSTGSEPATIRICCIEELATLCIAPRETMGVMLLTEKQTERQKKKRTIATENIISLWEILNKSNIQSHTVE